MKDIIILRNRARCEGCDTEIESKHRHDFATCRCGNIFVDGGLTYLRSGAVDISKFTDLSETYELIPNGDMV